jgi:hypothetical protein
MMDLLFVMVDVVIKDQPNCLWFVCFCLSSKNLAYAWAWSLVLEYVLLWVLTTGLCVCFIRLVRIFALNLVW